MKNKKRVSRDEWLSAGLKALADTGVESVKVERLARGLSVAKTGFYWHFRDRRELLDAMLEYWEREYTGAAANSPELLAMPAPERLLALSEAVAEYGLAEYDLAIADWARHDPRARERLQHAYSVRMAFVGRAFRDMGFTGNELEMRTRLFVCYTSNEEAMFGPCTSTRDRNLRKLRMRLLTLPLVDCRPENPSA